MASTKHLIISLVLLASELAVGFVPQPGATCGTMRPSLLWTMSSAGRGGDLPLGRSMYGTGKVGGRNVVREGPGGSGGGGGGGEGRHSFSASRVRSKGQTLGGQSKRVPAGRGGGGQAGSGDFFFEAMESGLSMLSTRAMVGTFFRAYDAQVNIVIVTITIIITIIMTIVAKQRIIMTQGILLCRLGTDQSADWQCSRSLS